MANEIRIRRNNMAGAITNNPLAMGATTINSPSFVDLPVIGATNHMLLILDPLEVAGPAEIVMVTAHTAAATSVTVIRGMEGTVDRAHVSGTVWYHGPATSDYIEVLTSGTRPATPYEGQAIYETDTNKFVGFGGVDWAPRDAGGQLGYAQVVANQTPIGGGGTDLTGLSITLTIPTSRRIRILGYGRIQNNAADVTAGIFIQEGASVLQADTCRPPVANEPETFLPTLIFTPSAGVHTYKLVGIGQVGILVANATSPAFILVEDIGAA